MVGVLLPETSVDQRSLNTSTENPQLSCRAPVALASLAFAQEPGEDEVTRAQFDAWMIELSNWGRWGDDDQLGALNLITDAKRVQAARLVETGRVVSMARDMTVDRSADAIAAGADRPPVLGGSVRNVFGIDTDNGYFWERYEIEYHGSLVTHIDALCHVAWNGRVYNGRAQRSRIGGQPAGGVLGVCAAERNEASSEA